MKKSFYIVLVILVLLLGVKSIGQFLSSLPRISTPEGIATAIGSSLYILGIISLFLKKRWAPILLGIVLLIEIISTVANGSISMSDKVSSSIINLILIVLAYFLYWKLKNKEVAV